MPKNAQNQEAQQILSNINKNKSIPRYIIMKLWNANSKEIKCNQNEKTDELQRNENLNKIKLLSLEESMKTMEDISTLRENNVNWEFYHSKGKNNNIFR